MRYLALDLGTSFLKGAVVDLDAPSIGHVWREPFPAALPGRPPLHVEVPVAAIVEATRRLLERLVAAAPDAAGVVVCSQMHGLVLADRQGRALSPAITWLDQRTIEPLPGSKRTYYDALLERLTPGQITALGNGLKPSLPVWILAQQALRGELPADALPVSLPDFVLSTLGGQPPVTEPTMAASMGMLDVANGEWHGDVLAALGLDGLILPPLVPVTAPTYTLRVGSHELPCYPPVGDHQAAVTGALLEPDELSINISTGSQVGVLAPAFTAGDYEVRPFFDGRFLQTIVRIPAGRALSALVKLLSELAAAEGHPPQDAWATIAAVVAATPTTDLDANIAFFDSPVGENGHLANLTEENLTVGHVFRAAFRSMAANYRVCADRLAPVQPPRRIVFSGGVAQRFASLREEILARFDLPMRLCPTEEDTLLGLLVLATHVAGRAPSVAAATAALKLSFRDNS
jgi:sugar (pentulose or hexulose) kinase